MGKSFDQRQQAAHSAMLRAISKTDQEIQQVYATAAKEMAAKAAKANPKGLTKRWQTEMTKSLRQSMRRVGGQVQQLIVTGSTNAAQLPVTATTRWLDDVLAATGHKGTDTSFASTLARTSDEALAQVISGRAYLDGKSLSKRIWSRVGRQEEGINSILKQGIAQKKSSGEVAKELQQYLNSAAKDSPDASYYAKRLARTSINHAYCLANREAQARNPFCTAMHWQLSARHSAQMTDICDEYASHDEGLGAGNWPVKSTPLGHACCLCSQYPVVPDSMEDCAKRMRNWLDGTDDPKLEAAFGTWMNEMRRKVKGEDAAYLADDKAAEKRKAALNSIASQPHVQQMSDLERQRYFDSLIDVGNAELETMANTPATSIHSPRNPAQGNPAAIGNKNFGPDYLSRRQSTLDALLPEYGSRATLSRNSINPRDTQALTAKNGVEYAVFTRGKQRTIVRGGAHSTPVDVTEAGAMRESGYRWSWHTHPSGAYSLVVSEGDYNVLQAFDQQQRVVYNVDGKQHVFSRRGR